MFGENPIAPIINKLDGKMLRVVAGSPFATIQGEGPYAGTPATFIRLHGCNLRCSFCDTQFSSVTDPIIPVEALVEACLRHDIKLVVITGGEPFRQNILPLCMQLTSEGFTIQIETAGTLWIDGIQNFAKIVVSPKTPSIHPKITQYAMAFKYVISAGNLHDKFIPITGTQPGTQPVRLAEPRPHCPIYLSPCDEYDSRINGANLRLVGELALRYRVHAGVQLHKMLRLD